MEKQFPQVCIDRITNIELDEKTVGRFHNELNVLNAWVHGLQFLYSQVKLMEEHANANISQIIGGDHKESEPVAMPAGLVFGNLSCCFQWYAVSLCNFVELIGAIGWELDKRRKPPRDYIKEVIPAVLAYRNNVGAHAGRARRNAANPAEQLLSLLPPSALFNGRYTAGMYGVSMRRSGNSTIGRGEPWSLTETHEKLAERYWPSLVDVVATRRRSDSS